MSHDQASASTSVLHTSIYNRLKQLKTIAVAGVGFFADAYDLFVINVVMIILGKMFTITHFDKSMVSTAALVGTMIGQLVQYTNLNCSIDMLIFDLI